MESTNKGNKGALIDGGMRNKREKEEQEWQQEILLYIFLNSLILGLAVLPAALVESENDPRVGENALWFVCLKELQEVDRRCNHVIMI